MGALSDGGPASASDRRFSGCSDNGWRCSFSRRLLGRRAVVFGHLWNLQRGHGRVLDRDHARQRARFGPSLAYSLATGVFGGFTPTVSTWLIHGRRRDGRGLWLSFAALMGLKSQRSCFRLSEPCASPSLPSRRHNGSTCKAVSAMHELSVRHRGGGTVTAPRGRAADAHLGALAKGQQQRSKWWRRARPGTKHPSASGAGPAGVSTALDGASAGPISFRESHAR